MESLDSIQQLLDSVTLLRERSLHCQTKSAPNFNLFRILDVETSEVSTHSTFLAHLLSPGETHAQGDLFLRRFLSEIGYEKLASFDEWVVSREVPFDGGRLDIVLQSAKASAIIVIENKIGTEDHRTQLNAYRSWLDVPHRKKFFKTRLLLYLTPKGDPAKNALPSIYKPIAYSEHISRWLSLCPEKPSRVKEAIEAYLLTIRNLNTKTLMRDDLDNKIINLLKTPANRSAALRVVRVGNLLKEEMLQEFWGKGEAYLRKELADERLAPYWTLDRARGSPLETRYSITLVGKGVDTKKPHPQFVFFQYSDARVFRWELAVKFDAWLGDHGKIAVLPEARKLNEIMDATFAMRKKHGWDGWLLFTDDAKGMERTLEDEIAKQSAVSDFFETGWKIFRKLEPYLRKLNNAVLHG